MWVVHIFGGSLNGGGDAEIYNAALHSWVAKASRSTQRSAGHNVLYETVNEKCRVSVTAVRDWILTWGVDSEINRIRQGF